MSDGETLIVCDIRKPGIVVDDNDYNITEDHSRISSLLRITWNYFIKPWSRYENYKPHPSGYG